MTDKKAIRVFVDQGAARQAVDVLTGKGVTAELHNPAEPSQADVQPVKEGHALYGAQILLIFSVDSRRAILMLDNMESGRSIEEYMGEVQPEAVAKGVQRVLPILFVMGFASLSIGLWGYIQDPGFYSARAAIAGGAMLAFALVFLLILRHRHRTSSVADID